jgi:hypothetical protein
MLDLAYNHKENLQEIFRREMLKPENKYFHISNWIDLKEPLKIYEYFNWDYCQYVSIDKEKNILGYLAFTVDNILNSISNLAIFSFQKKSFLFKKDLYDFIFYKIGKSNYFKVNFVCCRNNPSRKMYENIVKHANGRCVGYYEKDCQLIDNTIEDVYAYEIILNRQKLEQVFKE